LSSLFDLNSEFFLRVNDKWIQFGEIEVRLLDLFRDFDHRNVLPCGLQRQHLFQYASEHCAAHYKLKRREQLICVGMED
jgi:hypothetical protein